MISSPWTLDKCWWSWKRGGWLPGEQDTSCSCFKAQTIWCHFSVRSKIRNRVLLLWIQQGIGYTWNPPDLEEQNTLTEELATVSTPVYLGSNMKTCFLFTIYPYDLNSLQLVFDPLPMDASSSSELSQQILSHYPVPEFSDHNPRI